LLRDSRDATFYFCSNNEENKVYTVVSKWLNFWCSGFEILGKRLTLDDVMTENKVTQVGVGAGSSRAIDKPGSSNRRHRRR
jgi:hypothetical protein